MFEKEIQFITDFNLNKIKRLGSFFTLEDLTKAKIHPAIVQYISAEIDYLIFLDRQNLMQKSVFDYSGPDIAQHFLAISQEIKKNKLLPYEEVKKIIQQAVSFQITYLLRPVWTLKKFVFDTGEVRSQDEVKLFFNYVYFYDYYKKIFLTILEKKQLLTVSIYEFEALLEKIQKQLLEQQMKNVLENALTDMVEFLNIGEVTTKTRLSIETLEIFLKDKKLYDFIYKVRKRLSVDPKQKFELSEIQAVLFSPISAENEKEQYEEEVPLETPKDEAQLDIFKSAKAALNKDETNADDLLGYREKSEIEEPEIEDKESVELKSDENEITKSETEISHEEKNIAVGEQFSDNNSTDESDESVNLQHEAGEFLSPETESEKIPFEKYFQEELKKNEDSVEENSLLKNEREEESQSIEEKTVQENEGTNEDSEYDIFSYFTTKETMKIIGTIFNQDSLDFVNTLERISECSNEDEANQILKDVFLSYRVGSVGKEAMLLKEKIEQFFRDKEF
ncbi:MAG: hypothetical protein M0P61_05650 [Ignavibacteriaceae bacterium]|jgi:hypothetical protein|nr:hypothetical protein [Ignavibacteriaceae bacterium]